MLSDGVSTCLHLSSRLASPGREATVLGRPEKSSPTQFWRVWAFWVNGETELGKSKRTEQDLNTKITFHLFNSDLWELNILEIKRLKGEQMIRETLDMDPPTYLPDVRAFGLCRPGDDAWNGEASLAGVGEVGWVHLPG